MKLGYIIFNGNQFKNVILNSVSYTRLILGVNLIWSYVDVLITQFKTRVLADGGTFEAESYLIIQLNQIEIGSYVDALITQFKTRVLADGGTFEAESYLIIQLNQIKNIN